MPLILTPRLLQAIRLARRLHTDLHIYSGTLRQFLRVLCFMGDRRASLLVADLAKKLEDAGVTPSISRSQSCLAVNEVRSVVRLAFARRFLPFVPRELWLEYEGIVIEYVRLTGDVPSWPLLFRSLRRAGAVHVYAIVYGIGGFFLTLFLITLIFLSPFWPALAITAWARFPWLWSTTSGRVTTVALLLLVASGLYKLRTASRAVYGAAEIAVGTVICWTSVSPQQPGDWGTILRIAAGVYVIIRGIDNTVTGFREPTSLTARILDLFESVGGGRLGRAVKQAYAKNFGTQGGLGQPNNQRTSPAPNPGPQPDGTADAAPRG